MVSLWQLMVVTPGPHAKKIFLENVDKIYEFIT